MSVPERNCTAGKQRESESRTEVGIQFRTYTIIGRTCVHSTLIHNGYCYALQNTKTNSTLDL
jgi:hypothetical protein